MFNADADVVNPMTVTYAPTTAGDLTLTSKTDEASDLTYILTATAEKTHLLTTGAGSDSITITLADNNGIAAADTLAMGAGTDTATIALAGKVLALTADASWTGIETLKFTGEAGASSSLTFDSSSLPTGVTLVDASGITTGSFGITTTGYTTAHTIKAGAGSDTITPAIGIAVTVDLSAGGVDMVVLDAAGTDSAVRTITGFTTGATGDVLKISGGLTAGNVTVDVQAVGTSVTGENTTVGDADALVVLSGSAFQVAGLLTSTAVTGAVGTKILAAGLLDVTADGYFYVALDNGSSTGIYRVLAGGTITDAIDTAAELTSITLIGTIDVADSSLLVGPNFG